MWNDELIARLKKYVEAGRYFEVRYRNSRVFNVDERQPQHGDAGWPAFYLSQGYDNPLDLEKTQLTDFTVLLLKPISWDKQDPNWSEADPECWEEYVKETQK